MKRAAPVLQDGAVVVRHGVIEAIGPAERVLKKHRGHAVQRFENAVLMPGLANVHTHLELPPLLDVLRAKAFPDWVLNLIRAKKELDAGDYRISARQNIKTLIRTGTTTVGEICTHNISPAQLRQSGLRAVIFHEIISMGPSFKARRLKPASTPSLIRFGISPHAPHTVSEEVLRKIREMASRQNLPLAVHAVQATERDIAIINKTRTPVAHCPRSNHEIGVGRMPLKRFLDEGVTVGLGTDSLASSPSLSLWDEMRYAFSVHKKDGITAQDIMLMATAGGAKALGLQKEIGAIEPGKKADIIAVPLPARNMGDIYSDLLRETKSCIMTMVNGKIIYSPQRAQ